MEVINETPGRITSVGNAGQNQRISNVVTASSSPLTVVSGAGSMQSRSEEHTSELQSQR